MNYTKKDLAAYNLHLIKTKKFKTISVRVVFHTPIKKEDITKRILLSDILLQSSKKYESKRSMTIEAEELYSASISTGNQRLGNYIFTSFNLQVLNDKYTEEGNLEKSIEFLSEILFHPNINQKSFLKIESHTLEDLKGGKGIPDFYLFGFSDNFNILIIELLDKTIENVFEKNNKNFSVKTTAIIAIQLVRKKYINI